MGGTSADICLIQEGRPAVTHEGEIGPFPLQIPMNDIHTIGAGGGSIAVVTSLGSLTVGPQSAGAMPGPACYDQGGTAPTVTDANLVLGRIPPALLGGEVLLNLERARQAIHDHVAVPLGGNLLDAILAQYPAESMRAGDLYWYNDCYGTCGGVSHSPDMVFVAPVFYDHALVGFAETWGHL